MKVQFENQFWKFKALLLNIRYASYELKKIYDLFVLYNKSKIQTMGWLNRFLKTQLSLAKNIMIKTFTSMRVTKVKFQNIHFTVDLFLWKSCPPITNKFDTIGIELKFLMLES